MFNLITTLLICLGMSNSGMPISNYKENTNKEHVEIIQPKKANENTTTQYTLNINTTNETLAYTDINNNRLSYRSRQITGGNEYINVIGNLYQTEMRQNNATENHIIGNYENLIVNNVYNGNLNNYTNAKMCYVLQITPYNYNVDTQIRIGISITFNGAYTQAYENNNTYYYQYSKYYENIRRYKSIDNSFQNYIGRQNTSSNITDIETDITNINNGYYYEYDEETQLIYEGTTYNNTYNIWQEITITPQTNNYFVWVIEPLGELNDQWYEDNAQIKPTENTLYIAVSGTSTYWAQRPYNTDAIRIIGTNIIPSGTYEVIDIPGMMFEILGMPFTFISTAFNLTIFPNTPYQINISNLFLAILGLLVFIFLLRLLIKAGLSIGG